MDKSMKPELLARFPVVMRRAFRDYALELPEGTEFHYQPVQAYRIVYRKTGEVSAITREDFRSMAELGQRPKRGVDPTHNPLYYGTSLFKDMEEARYKFRLLRYNKKIIRGYIMDECGPFLDAQKNMGSHVTWWLYEDANISACDFQVIEDE